jgi:hypothetical protein
MGLTIFAYALGVFTLVMSSYMKDRIGGTWLGRNVLIAFVGFGVLSIANAVAVDFAGWSNIGVPLFFYKLGIASLAFGAVFFLRTAFSYPYDAKNRFLDVMAWILALVSSYVIVFTDQCVIGFNKVSGRLAIGQGPWFYVLVFGLWGMIALASLTLFIRSLLMKSRIYRFQCSIIVLSGLVATAAGILFQTLVFDRVAILYPLIGLAGFVLMMGSYWAISITKLFDLRDIMGLVLASVFVALIAGVPIGLGAAWLLMKWNVQPAIPLAAVPALFIAASYLFSLIGEWLFKAFSQKGDYLAALETGLAEIDFSQGRGIVFDKLSEVLRSSMNFNDFSVMIEDSEGNLQVVHSNCGAKLSIEHKVSPFEFVINMKTDIVLKTEAIANHNFHTIKTQLLDIFVALNADAIIVLHEGHHVIGLISLGQKKSGADYTSYDSNVLRMVYGKLFAIGFYLKNIAKESILTTVDRELQYSSQIIASVQDNIDRVDHPKTDLAFISRSTRKLGGDFIDFVKLSPDRWFFVVGDVSGKGLNASMSMIILKSTIRIFLKEERDFSRLVVKANAFIKENLPRGTFFAGVFGIFDFAKDAMYFVNCGIPVMFMYSPQYNNVMEIQGEGRVLGFVKDYAPYLKLRKMSLQKGSILVITTDGIIESESLRNERYGKERVQRAVTEFKGYPAENMAQMTFNSLEKFVSGEINDDVTIMALKYQAGK